MASIYSRGTAQIRHSGTGEVFEIAADELEWAEFASDDRQMGIEIGHSAVVHHPALGQITWELWEYPVGAENMRETHTNGHELLANMDFGLEHFPEDDELEVEYRALFARLAALPSQLDELDRILAELRRRSPMIGHNQPPEQIGIDIDPVQIDEVRRSIAETRGELIKRYDPEVADLEVIQHAENRFRQLAATIGNLTKSGTMLAAKGAAAAAAGLIAKEIIIQDATLYELVVTIADTLRSWLLFLGAL